MNKADLVAHVAESASLTKAQAESAIASIGAAVHAVLKKGGEVALPDIGKLKVAKRPARVGRNPKTGESLKIAAKKVVKFSAAKGLKDHLN